LIIKHILRISLLCLALVAGSSHGSEKTVLILGDSISAAYGMSVQQGWVAHFSRQLASSHPEVTVINASISGETTGGGLRRLPALLDAHQPSLVVVELGANDGLRGYPITRFRSNLEQIVALSQANGAQVVLLQMEIPPNYGSRYTQAFHDSYARVANASDSSLSPFLLEGVAGNPTLTQADGIHPTIEAQERLLQNVLPTLLEALQ